jgi:hypothetical protein
MRTFSRLPSLLLCSAILGATGLVASAGVIRVQAPRAIQTQQPQTVRYLGDGWWNENGVIYHTPHYMMTRWQAAFMRPQPDTRLGYGGGPVLLKPDIYVVFWGFGAAGDPHGLRSLMTNYLRRVGGSGIENVTTQYYGPGHVHIQNNPGELKGVLVDNSPIPSQPSDGQVAAEAIKLMQHFGGFDANGSYVVQTAHNHNTSGFGSSFCAYHSAVSAPGGVISYTNEPYIPDAGSNCGANIISPPSDESAVDEGATIVEGHELTESITDPQPFSGWNSGAGEIGDLCAWTNIQNDPFSGGHSYTQQPEFSNATSSCVHSYP